MYTCDHGAGQWQKLQWTVLAANIKYVHICTTLVFTESNSLNVLGGKSFMVYQI